MGDDWSSVLPGGQTSSHAHSNWFHIPISPRKRDACFDFNSQNYFHLKTGVGLMDGRRSPSDCSIHNHRKERQLKQKQFEFVCVEVGEG